MTFNSNLEALAVKLFDISAVKFGEFITKSGIKTPVYFDLRVIVSFPDVMEMISSLLYEFIINDNSSNHLCGVPYTALPIATLLSVKAKKSMLMRRKEAKAYGTKKMIEGHYENGQTCLIVEDVVTSGSSVLETVKDLQKEGLVCKEAIIILDREQGGRQNLENNGVTMKSLFTMTQLINILLKHGKINKQISNEVEKYLEQTQAPTLKMITTDRSTIPYEKRAELATNNISKKLFNIMATKKTNLCLSVDLTKSNQILDLLERVGNELCLVKTHIDILEDFSPDFIDQLKELANKYNFLIMEDRKFADIGNTVCLQYTKGLYRVSEWADLVTVHSLPGEGILKGLKSVCNEADRGVILLAEMSSDGHLFTEEYMEKTVKMAEKYPELVSGFVCQKKTTFDDPGLIQMTPGVQLESSTDGFGQVYNTPEVIMNERGADIAIVGRGIISAKSPEVQAKIYKEALWQCYLKRIV